MSKLGQHLKTQREKKGLSLHEIGLSLKINPKILSALEDGRKEGLPAKTFLRGFVKSYAQYLRLDLNETMNLFNEEYDVKKEPPVVTESGLIEPSTSAPAKLSVVPAPPREESTFSRPQKSKYLVAFFSVCAFIVVIFIYKMVDKYQKERASRPLTSEVLEEFAQESSPIQVIPDTTPTPSAEAVWLGPPSAQQSAPMTPAQSTAAQQETPTASVTPMPIPSPTPLVKTSTTVTPTPKSSVTPTPTPSPAKPTPSPTPSVTPTPQSNPSATPEARPTEIIIEAIKPVKILVTLPDGKKQTIDLGADKLHTIRAKGTIGLELSDAGAVNLIVNGRDRGAPGPAGQSIKLSLPK